MLHHLMPIVVFFVVVLFFCGGGFGVRLWGFWCETVVGGDMGGGIDGCWHGGWAVGCGGGGWSFLFYFVFLYIVGSFNVISILV